MPIDLNDFKLLRDLVYERTGIMFEDRKEAFVAGRLAGRLLARGLQNARDYYRFLRYQDPEGVEFQSFVESLTTNETYFFREFPQLQSFADEALSLVAHAKRAKGDYTLSIWSAACSTGDEPYTLAIILRECLDDFDKWNIQLLATDIDTNVLSRARRAIYSERAVRDVPKAYIERYFSRHDDQYRVVPEIVGMVKFQHLNLMDRAGMRLHQDFEFIFCRNALIYFDPASSRQVLGGFYDALVPGGYIFLGHSESVGRISAAYEMVRLGETITYRRPSIAVGGQIAVSGGHSCRTA